MRRQLTVRNTLLAVGVIGALLVAMLAADRWHMAWQDREDASRILNYAEIADALLSADYHWAAERLRAQLALKGEMVATEGAREAIVSARTRADDAYSSAITQIEAQPVETRLAGMLAGATATYARLAELRPEVDAALQNPRDLRKVWVLRDWFGYATQMIDQSRQLAAAVRSQTVARAPNLEALRSLVLAVATMREFAYREQALIAGTIAAGEFLVLKDAERLAHYQGNFQRALEAVEVYARQPEAEARIAAQIADVPEAYVREFQSVRVPVIRAGMEGSPYPLSAAAWIESAEHAIAPMARLAETVAGAARAATLGQLRRAERELIIASLILLATLAIGALSTWIVIGWVVRPLARITTVMTALAGGERGQQVPETERGGEIGAMARAVESFRLAAERHADEVHAANEALETRVRERTADLAAARDQALAASTAKSQFLANMSHELRTPLTVIMGLAEMLIEQAEAREADAPAPALENIREAGGHLLALVDDVLDLSKIEAGRMELTIEEFDLAELIRSTADSVRALADVNGNSLDVVVEDRIDVVRSDPTKIRQALLNLLGNACKFTRNGDVRLVVRRTRAGEEEMAEVRVEDTGIGMSANEIDRVFDAFTQADASTTRRYGGSGLGLTITQRILRLLGGDVAVDSTAGSGSTFILRFPIWLAPSRAGA